MIFMDGSVVVPIRRERLLGIDVLKIYAIVMVVRLHILSFVMSTNLSQTINR